MSPDRRRYSRFDLPDGTQAMDESGRLIGRVERAGAGGLQIRLDSGCEVKPQVGENRQFTVLDSKGRSHQLRVEIRFVQQDILGVRFLDHELSPPPQR